MSAPDLPPPPQHLVTQRPLSVHLHVKLVPPESLRGGIAIVIDALRASVTMTAALFHGAAHIEPVLTVEDARAAAASHPRDSVLLGGERGGTMIPGFDLDNSPLKYTRTRVAGKAVVFTTTNGTAALLHSKQADLVLIGSFANLSAICNAVAHDPRPVHIICCGTRDEISLDDVLPAGAMAKRLVAAERQLLSDDSARVAIAAFDGAMSHHPMPGAPNGLTRAMFESRGGRNLDRLGLAEDVAFCSRIDTLPIVPRFDPATSRVIPWTG